MDTSSRPGLPAILNRIVGLTLILLFLLGYEPSGSGVGNSLLLPLALALGSWMILRSALALALAATLLAGGAAAGPVGCKVELDLQFEFSRHLLTGMLQSFVSGAANGLVDAFCVRAGELYQEGGRT